MKEATWRFRSAKNKVTFNLHLSSGTDAIFFSPAHDSLPVVLCPKIPTLKYAKTSRQTAFVPMGIIADLNTSSQAKVVAMGSISEAKLRTTNTPILHKIINPTTQVITAKILLGIMGAEGHQKITLTPN